MRYNFKRVISLAVVVAFAVMALPFGSLVGAANPVELTKGLKAYYTFDERSESKVVDNSGSKFDGILQFDPGWSDGKVGGSAIKFDWPGSIDVNSDIFKEADTNKALAISMWIKPEKHPDGLEWALVGKKRFLILLNKDGYIKGCVGAAINEKDPVTGWDGFFDTQVAGATDKVQFGEWNHIVLQQKIFGDGNPGFEVYLNGAVQLAWGKPYMGMATADNTERLHIGDDGTRKGYMGLMDDVRIYTRALNSDEIQALVKFQPPVTPPVVNKISDSAKIVTGTAQRGNTVVVRREGEDIGSAVVGRDGKFSVTIKAQKSGTVLEVVSQNKAGDESAPTEKKVIHKAIPAAPKVSAVTSKSTSVKGTAEKGAKITVKAGKITLGTATVASNGKFTIKIKAQKAKTVLSVTATDTAGGASKSATVTVK